MKSTTPIRKIDSAVFSWAKSVSTGNMKGLPLNPPGSTTEKKCRVDITSIPSCELEIVRYSVADNALRCLLYDSSTFDSWIGTGTADECRKFAAGIIVSNYAPEDFVNDEVDTFDLVQQSTEKIFRLLVKMVDDGEHIPGMNDAAFRNGRWYVDGLCSNFDGLYISHSPLKGLDVLSMVKIGDMEPVFFSGKTLDVSRGKAIRFIQLANKSNPGEIQPKFNVFHSVQEMRIVYTEEGNLVSMAVVAENVFIAGRRNKKIVDIGTDVDDLVLLYAQGGTTDSILCVSSATVDGFTELHGIGVDFAEINKN